MLRGIAPRNLAPISTGYAVMGFFDIFKKRVPIEPVQAVTLAVPEPPAFKERLVTRAELAHLSDEVEVVVESVGATGTRTYMQGLPSVLRDVFGDSAPKKRSRRRTKPRTTRSHDFMGLAGESHRQPALSALLSAGGPYVATLTPEPTNPHDKKAVKVIVNSEHVGYLKRETARQFGSAIAEAGSPVQCTATLHPPVSPNTNIAVTLDFSKVYGLVESDDNEDEDEDQDEE